MPKRDPSARPASKEFKQQAVACMKEFVDGKRVISYHLFGRRRHALKIPELFATIREIATKMRIY
ncbi:MAG: hypothetical protein HY744_05025 [Deltaproteobacteria bacterium]|nr:hypothetical protein [Deltaproteobacteria bacterium]